ncbi:MAG: FtsK/SpoIIIE domain-containing protein [bacterium]
MSLLGLHLDKPRRGTQHSDAMLRILGVCHQHGIATRLVHTANGDYRQTLIEAGITDVPDNMPFVRYSLHVLDTSVLRKLLSLAPAFATALNVDSVQVKREGDTVWVRVATPHQSVALTYAAAFALCPDMPADHLLLGQDDEGDQMTLDTTANVHVLVAGQTHSGKSTLLRTMALSALVAQRPVALVDPSGDIAPLSGMPAVWQGGYFDRLDDIAAVLYFLAQRTRHNLDTPLLLFVDEGTELCRNAANADNLSTIARMGRHIGLRLIFGAQTLTGLPADIKANLLARLIGRTSDAQQSAWLAGRKRAGAEYSHGRGDFTAFTAATGREGAHFQAACPDDTLDATWLKRYPPRRGVVPVWQADMPAAEYGGHQITPSPQAATFASEMPVGDPGRRCDDLPADVARKIAAYYAANHRPPARRMIAGWIQERDIDKDKHHRWLGAVLPRRALR